jgi:hypothetical protein
MSIWLDGYRYEYINKIINEKTKKEIVLISFWPYKSNGKLVFNDNLIFYVRVDEFKTKQHYNPRKRNSIKLVDYNESLIIEWF